MSCNNIRLLITSYLLDELEGEQRSTVQAHIESCADCRAQAEALRTELRLLISSLASDEGAPSSLSQNSLNKLMRSFRRRNRRSPLRRSFLYALAATIMVTLLSGLLLPNSAVVRERARQVNEFAHLSMLRKEAEAWVLNPADSFSPSFLEPLELLVEEGAISADSLVSPLSGKPIGYYSGPSSDGNQPILVSASEGGRHVVGIAGAGEWVKDGTPQDDKLDGQLEQLRQSDAARREGGTTLSHPSPVPNAAPPAKSVVSARYRRLDKEVAMSEAKAEQDSSATRLAGAAQPGFLFASEPMDAPDDIEMDKALLIGREGGDRREKVRIFQQEWLVRGNFSDKVSSKLTLCQVQHRDGAAQDNKGALSNLLHEIGQWSDGQIIVDETPQTLALDSSDLFELKPPLVFFSGDGDFKLSEPEVRNLRDYLMLGGMLWVDNAGADVDSPFARALKRELKRVFPDRELVALGEDHPLFNSFFKELGTPPGWNGACAPLEALNIADNLAVLYTPNNYGRLWAYRLGENNLIEPQSTQLPAIPDTTIADAYKLGINAVMHMLTRYQKHFEPIEKEAQKPQVPARRAAGVNPFVTAASQPFSTFSLSVDSAAYAHARNYLLRGMLPPSESVRTEEFVNFFDYDYAPPVADTFAVHTHCGESAFGRGLKLLKIGLKGRVLGREEKKAAVLTLLVDTSGSMATPDRLGLARQALIRMVDRLDPADKVAVVQFDSHARLVLAHTPVSNKQEIIQAIENMQTSGSTSLEEGMALAYSVAARGFEGGCANRVMLVTDGMANLGTTSAAAILDSVAEYRRQNITLSVFGFGFGSYNDSMLEELANKGDGAYAFIDSMEEAQRVMVDELAATVNIIARDVKIQVEFNPNRVVRYRQLGYETRALKKEDFRDNSVDAGEIGSGQSATALYELELADGGSREPIGAVRVRCRNAITEMTEEIERPIMPPADAKPFSDMDPHFKLAACAAHFAEILRGSPYAAGSSFGDVARMLHPVTLELSLDLRIQELLRLTQTGLSPKFEE